MEVIVAAVRDVAPHLLNTLVGVSHLTAEHTVSMVSTSYFSHGKLIWLMFVMGVICLGRKRIVQIVLQAIQTYSITTSVVRL